jgi:hypothetical protein
MTAQIVVTPDVQAIVATYLRTTLPTISGQASVSVTSQVPNPRPAAFVIVKSTGGAGRENLVQDRSDLIVEAWANTEAAANTLARNAYGATLAMQGQSVSSAQIYKVEVGGAPANLPDPTSDQFRFTFTVELRVRATKVTVTP